MANYKPQKIETYRDKYFTTIIYLYRGSKYEVVYPNGFNVCCTPAYIQHRDAQAEIDEIINNPKKPLKCEPAEKGLEAFFKYFET